MSQEEKIQAVVEIHLDGRICDCLDDDCGGCIPQYTVNEDGTIEQWEVVRPGKVQSEVIGKTLQSSLQAAEVRAEKAEAENARLRIFAKAVANPEGLAKEMVDGVYD